MIYKKMPVLFVGHGSPMNAIQENIFSKGWKDIVKTFPKPKAIVCISAHWVVTGSNLTVREENETIHDFYGFPKELYDVEYKSKGDASLAKRIKVLLEDFIQVDLDDSWGIDHGAWSVLRNMYPDADIPVLQLSLNNLKENNFHFELGKKLNILREEGILILGSGNIIHNLGLVDFENFEKDDHGYSWAVSVREKINKLLTEKNFQALVDCDSLKQEVELFAPTPEHYIPLLYILGASDKDEPLEIFNDKLVAGSISMTSIKIG